MAPKKSRKLIQDITREEPTQDLEWRAPKSRGETHLRVPRSQVAESW
jgi:hypothetical protein